MKNLRYSSCFFQLEYNGGLRFAQVFYYLHLQITPTEKKAIAVVSILSSHHKGLFDLSNKTLRSCRDEGDLAIFIVDVKKIKSVVSMVPHYPVLPEHDEHDGEPHLRWFLVEKPGLDVTHITEHGEDVLDKE